MHRPQPDAVPPAGGEPPPLPDYSSDFALWLQTQAQLLRERKFDLLDVENLAEEVDGMARKEHRELRRRLRIVLLHLLKFQFQPDHQPGSWSSTLAEQRDQIADLLKDSPSLHGQAIAYADEVYRSAARAAALETGLPISTFPAANPFSQAELLDPDFVP